MSDQTSTSLQEAKERLDEWRRRSAELPKLRDKLAGEEYRLGALEGCCEQIESEIAELDSATLAGFVAWLSGGKEKRLTERREESHALKQQCDECAANVEALVKEVEAMTGRIADMEGAKEAFEALWEQTEQQVLAAGGEAAHQLQQLVADSDAVEAQQRVLERTIQTGEHVLDRLHVMNKALGRARSKLTNFNPLGVIGAAATSAISRKGASAAISRVRQGLEQFAEHLGAVDLSEVSELDMDIIRLRAAIEGQQTEMGGAWASNPLCDMSVTLPVMELVQTVIGHLKSKLDQKADRTADIESRRAKLIEGA